MYEDRTYAALLAEGKAQISDNILKSEGSLVHNALSIIAYELERFYIEADYLLKQIDPAQADYDNLVKLCAQRGIYPKDATAAVVKIVGNVTIPIGARFNLSAYNYIITEVIDAESFVYAAQCETPGSAPNGLTGATTAITYVPGLTSAIITELLVAGTDATTKDELLAEYEDSFDSSSFGGNVAEYKAKINAFDGIGGCKIYPVWQGGGTVKAVLISSDYGEVSDYLVAEIQEAMCPTPSVGYGIAAIGHDMTVVSVDAVTVNIETSITYMTGHSWADCGAAITAAVQAYMLAQRQAWASGDENSNLTVYVSRVESAILSVEGVLDVGDTTLNGSGTNLALDWDEIPVLGTITEAD